MDSRTTFTQFIAHHGRVQIPIIQRDYAQGRADQKEVRNEFLRALHSALLLPADDPRLPLDLDFVYGSVVGNAFQPLDGQQRLTTLFLLHWYLAWVDGKLADFRKRLVEGGKSRFGYQVRPSSKDFVDEMAHFDPGQFMAECDLVALIKDQPWYVRSWQFDQTIRSALEMLGAMHEVFGQPAELYDRLVDDENPAITFQLLDLQRFDLSDELYIKMNARGKPLTSFETFKARFEQRLKGDFSSLQLPLCGSLPLADFFARRMDKEWSDFFWPYKDDATATFDNAIMNVLRVVILVTRDPEIIDPTNADIADLRGSVPNTFTAFNEKNWLDRNFVVALISLLESWSKQGGKLPAHLPDDSPFDLSAIFKQMIGDPARLTFQDLALFAGYVQFIVAYGEEIDKNAFGDWMRVVFNLVINTDYNRPDDLRRSLSGLADLKPWMTKINTFLVKPDADIRGFSQPQVAEERLKAHLINLGDGWSSRIMRAERHDYLKGQIGFLLRFSELGFDDERTEVASLDLSRAKEVVPSFEHYFACASQMLKDLHSAGAAGRAWELALLAVGDILLPVGRNHALPGLKEGPGSWKRLLRLAGAGDYQGDVLKDLWDRLDEPTDAQAMLKQIIDSQPDVDDWRRAIIDTPAIYQYCGERMIRFNDEGIYPLRRSQMNGAHAELYTYCLHADLTAMGESISLKPDYYETFSADEPELGLNAQIGDIEYAFLAESKQEDGPYHLWLYDPESPAKSVADLLVLEGFVIEDGYWTKTVERDQLKSAVLDLDAAITPLLQDHTV
ncbi:DUF262 domain-containing protein [Mesorhizobium sp. CO1-1-7]|uniref:DUF262 domain-containing protein n=1 Tax=Mesorhizobium sp. CO1-1-7 TaxID=2876632 RepID=UPI001CD0D2CB|nr:DUF262 domain-containing protein [Mesorhizobium sp. CO1-1-7]MBZ9746792.1 DUF262 domain-containing protein [Mesorhizobium sp. CO1-1-7]